MDNKNENVKTLRALCVDLVTAIMHSCGSKLHYNLLSTIFANQVVHEKHTNECSGCIRSTRLTLKQLCAGNSYEKNLNSSPSGDTGSFQGQIEQFNETLSQMKAKRKF